MCSSLDHPCLNGAFLRGKGGGGGGLLAVVGGGGRVRCTGCSGCSGFEIVSSFLVIIGGDDRIGGADEDKVGEVEPGRVWKGQRPMR